jgi:hypothetical protein
MKKNSVWGIAVLLTSVSLWAAPFTFSKGSVFEKTPNVKPDTVILSNTTNQFLIIDSVVVLFDKSQMPEFQIGFLINPFDTIRNQEFLFDGSPYRKSGYKLALKPMESIKLLEFQFDLCVRCPCMAKRSEVLVGDTIAAGLIFYSRNFSDTLRLKGIRNVKSTGIINQSQLRNSNHQPVSNDLYDLSGRKMMTDPFVGKRSLNKVKIVKKTNVLY